MIAYNLMSIFRIFVLQEKAQERRSILRCRNYFEKAEDALKLKNISFKKTPKMVRWLWNCPVDLAAKISNA
jgi:hypothetical protein